MAPAPPFEQTTPREANNMARDLALASLLDRLEAMSIRGLRRMFSEREQMFTFRVRRTSDGVVQEGLSDRYTAITMLGLARMRPEVAVGAVTGTPLEDVRGAMLRRAATSRNLGDVALSLWAGDEGGADAAALEPVLRRLQELKPAADTHPVVELAWTVSALSDARAISAPMLRDDVARRLIGTFSQRSRLFPHAADSKGARAHVSCFADIIYPIQALAKYAAAVRSQQALDIASTCAGHLCSRQGDAGQWWWHYDYRTSEVLEGYPVYAIHQDAMGPMGLRALREAGGLDCSAATRRGMQWLVSSPELGGGSLIDGEADLIWRKVARREPGKLVRYMQSGVSLLHSSLRVPAVDLAFPPGTIDYEDRPYHLGWLLYAWAGAGLPGAKS